MLFVVKLVQTCFVQNYCVYLMVNGSKCHHRIHLKLSIEKTTFRALVLCCMLDCTTTLFIPFALVFSSIQMNSISF